MKKFVCEVDPPASGSNSTSTHGGGSPVSGSNSTSTHGGGPPISGSNSTSTHGGGSPASGSNSTSTHGGGSPASGSNSTSTHGGGSPADDGNDDEVVMTNEEIGIKCAYTQQIMKFPIRNKHCGHNYERDAILDFIRRRMPKTSGTKNLAK